MTQTPTPDTDRPKQTNLEAELIAAKLARTPEELFVKRNQRRYFITAIIGWWLIVAGFVVIIQPQWLDNHMFGYGLIIVGIVLIPVAFLLHKLRKPLIIINAEGYLDRRMAVGLIPWDALKFISFGSRGTRRIIRFGFIDPAPFQAKYKEPKRYRRKQQISFHDDQMTLAYDNMNYDTKLILEVMRKVSGKQGQFQGKFGVKV